jgi:predicted RNase H-like HicB family nuclease
MMRNYLAVVFKDPKSDYGVSFPDFPGCVTAGSTPEEARDMAQEALQFHIDGMLEDRAVLPEPSPLTEQLGKRRQKGVLGFFWVPIRLPSGAKRINITLDENLLNDIDSAATESGMTRSGFLAEGARRLLIG